MRQIGVDWVIKGLFDENGQWVRLGTVDSKRQAGDLVEILSQKSYENVSRPVLIGTAMVDPTRFCGFDFELEQEYYVDC